MAGFDEEEIEFRADEDDVNLLELEKASEDAPVVRLVNMILLNAIKKGASDIHIEPYEKKLRVRYRIDGVLIEEMTPPLKLKNAISSRLKIMSQLDIAERRLPQDGRIKLKLGKGREMDFRVSVLADAVGREDRPAPPRQVEPAARHDQARLRRAAARPTSSGPSTSPGEWCSSRAPPARARRRRSTRRSPSSTSRRHNISTAEDPVEYNLHGINQVQMHDEIGLNFATALRAFLRQDPDIIMVGEIRDFETAEIAVKAALTGHMVLSTLHTNDAPATISRLLNMGVEPFLITASVNLVLAQRLARKICADCQPRSRSSTGRRWSTSASRMQQIARAKLMKGAGCRTCNGTGYKGRVALYEVMRFSEQLKEMVLQGASTAELKAAAIKQGMTTLRASGIHKVLQGVTSTEEVLRVTMGD